MNTIKHQMNEKSSVTHNGALLHRGILLNFRTRCIISRCTSRCASKVSYLFHACLVMNYLLYLFHVIRYFPHLRAAGYWSLFVSLRISHDNVFHITNSFNRNSICYLLNSSASTQLLGVSIGENKLQLYTTLRLVIGPILMPTCALFSITITWDSGLGHLYETSSFALCSAHSLKPGQHP